MKVAMGEVLLSAQMREIEAAAMAGDRVTGAELMERAGSEVVAAARAAWPELAAGGRALVLAGPGNNGGDGFVIARLLAEAGWEVAVQVQGDRARLGPDAQAMAAAWRGPVLPPEARPEAPLDLAVDALFGTGLSRTIPDAAAQALRAARARAARLVAVDCPSGLDCDSGRLHLPEDTAADDIAADLTVTFHRPKRGHYLGQGPEVCGRLVIADIGLPAAATAPEALPPPGRIRLVARAPGWPAALIAATRPGVHKYDRGHALVLGGGVGKGGAARMAARAALRIGAGLVTVAVPPAALIENAAQLNAIMLTRLADAGALAEMLGDDRLSALCLGPGLGTGEGTRALVGAALAAERFTVLDADALSSFRDDPPALFSRLHPRCVLTPHEGEFARLFPDLAQGARAAAGRSKADAAAEAAERAGCTVLLKGPDTIIASPGGHLSLSASLYERRTTWLGTAGAGDVLAGMIAGLGAAPGAKAHLVAEAAAWLHVEAALSFGPGLIAEDLPEALPGVLRGLRGL
ncbi:YjeF family protein [Oceanicola granulosus HTCC2516]|uniref:Bifunctional NAD(P)H-hydrate repair enzyme n=2 Tax=Oceanicola granulosus TaxID=252302 RepID=Q2CHQ7_OCEGH|nr:YjeF family protein [Oceanicola granulosus HTCC2516]